MIAQYALIPDTAFLYFPSPSKQIDRRPEGKQRIIFGGGINFDDDQIQKIKKLRSQINSNNKTSYLNGFPDDFLLRFLQASSFNNKECIETLENYYVWQKKYLPLEITQTSFRLLKQGILYLCGRDCQFRPIIVVDVKKILDLKIKQNELLDTLGFFFQYVIQHCLIEGQVQTWNTIIDLGNCSVFSLGGTLVDIIKYLSNIFKSRLNRNFMVKCPGSMKMIWGMVKKALTQDQLKKISLSDKKTLKQQDFSMINRNQVQVKYGGSRPDIRNYWPIQIGPYQTSVPNQIVSLITQNQYDKLFNEGQLRDRKIKKSFIKKFQHLRKKSTLHLQQDAMTQKNQMSIEDHQVIYPEQTGPPQLQQLQPVPTFDELFSL